MYEQDFLVGNSKAPSRKKLCFWVVVFLALFLHAESAFSDTYNFFFTKPKKKASSQAPKEESPETESPEEDTEGSSNEPSKAGEAKTSQAPIVIHNNNNITNSLPPPLVDSTPHRSSEVVVQGPRPTVPPWRFGFGGSYFFQKKEKKGLFDDDDFFTRDPFTRRIPGPTETKTNAYGGIVSFAYTASPYFAINAFGGVHRPASKAENRFRLGMDLEFYPFASSQGIYEVSPLELGLILGGDTGFSFSEDLIGVHGGARLNINLSSKFGITAVGRASTDHLMVEAGLITRL